MRTHKDTSAQTGMLRTAQRSKQPQRTWCQRYTKAAPSHRGPTYPHPSFVSQGPKREKDEPARKKTETHTRAEAGKKCMPGRGASKGRVKSGEATKETRGSQQLSKRRAQGREHGRHTAHGGHNTAPKHRRGEHQRDRRKAAPRTTTRTAQTPHTPHTPTQAPTVRGQRAPAARPRGGQQGRGGARTQTPPATPMARPPTGHASHGAGAGPPRPHTSAHGTWVADPDSPPRGRAAGGGGAPDPRRPSQRWKATPPRERPPTTPAARSPHRACRPRGQCWTPTAEHLRPQHVGGGSRQPAQWAGSRGRGSA